MTWQQQLAQWRVDRNISLTNQYIPMIEEELQEYLEATTPEQQVDAVCDILVFTENQLVLENIDPSLSIIETTGLPDYFVDVITYKIVQYHGTDMTNEQLYHFIKSTCYQQLQLLNYNVDLAMEETIKEISSRRQDPEQAHQWSINGPSGKWQKDKQQDPATLYTADYTKCRLTQPS